jgi:hypothetical protein
MMLESHFNRGYRHGQEGTQWYPNTDRYGFGAYLDYKDGHAAGRGRGMSETPQFESIGDNLWMRCKCGFWMLVQSRFRPRGAPHDVEERTFVTKRCHNRNCNQLWERQNNTWVEVN